MCYLEPTSALDSESCAAVERSIIDEVHSIDNPLRAVIWITHSDEQGARVGNRFIQISASGCYEEPIPVV
jgi:ABC-type iron transport system FetAB ATPase subunit